MTRKGLLGLLTGVLLVGLLGLADTGSVRADAPAVSDLVALARYYPTETPLFATFDTSEQLFDDLDGLLAVLRTSIPDLIPSDVNAGDLVDELSGGGFASMIRPWLGDRVGVGVLDVESVSDSQPSVLVAIEITGREAARAFLDTSMSNASSRYTESEVRDYTLFVDTSFQQMHYLLGEDVLFISNDLDYLETTLSSGDFARLSDNASFHETFGLLPEQSYYGLAYMNTSAVIGSEALDEFSDDSPMMAVYQSLAEADIHQSFGMTILDGRTLTIDYANNVGSYEAFASLLLGEGGTFPDPSAYPPVDLGFASHLSARSQLVIQGSGLGAQISGFFDTMSMYGNIFQQMMNDEFFRYGMGMGSVPFLDSDWGGLAQGWTTVTFAGLTGLNLNADVLSWMTGDYAMFLDLIAVESDLTLSLDMGFITRNTDSAAANNVLSKITSAAERYGLVNTTETHGSGSALVLPQPVRILFPPDFMVSKDVIDATPELDVMVGVSEDVFVAGSRPGVEYALNPSGESLADTAAFASAVESLFLPGSQAVFYIGFDALADALRETGLAGMSRDMAEVMYVLGAFESATISTVSHSLEHSTGRMTLTLAER